MQHFYFTLLFIFILMGNFNSSTPQSIDALREEIIKKISLSDGIFSAAFKDLQTGDTLFINEKENFHAASTMKTPVMIEVFKQAAEGKFSLNDSVAIKNEFISIVDASIYSMDINEDSGDELYTFIGKERTIYQLIYDMITVSSNLATNILIDITGAENIMNTMNAAGANDIRILRGVEDIKAYRLGLNNTTTAFDQLIIYENLALGNFVSNEVSASMVDILLHQRHKDRIPAKLPSDTKIAHKTGWITGTSHDGGIIFLPGERKYILILSAKNFSDDALTKELQQDISRLIYDYMINK
jgi:beta-lactamase class A